MTVVDRKQAETQKILPLRELFTVKYDNVLSKVRYKVRICARGDLCKEVSDNYAPVASTDCVRAMLILCIEQNLQVRQLDVSCAFLFAEGNKDRYFELPFGHRSRDKKKKVWKTRCALYGLASAPKLWHSCIQSKLLE